MLFSIGVVTTITPLNIFIVIPLLIFAAIFGFLFNYEMGKLFGKWILKKEINTIVKSYNKTNLFIEKNGSRAIVISRFFPVVRTYLPFVAGIVKMNYVVFFKKTILGGILWVSIFVLLGHFLGEINWVRTNYGVIFLCLIFLTLLPLVFQLINNKLKK